METWSVDVNRLLNLMKACGEWQPLVIHRDTAVQSGAQGGMEGFCSGIYMETWSVDVNWLLNLRKACGEWQPLVTQRDAAVQSGAQEGMEGFYSDVIAVHIVGQG